MSRSKIKPSEKALEEILGEASWLLSHADALNAYGRPEEAQAELLRAANCEEKAAYWLDALNREPEAVVHRVSAASCYEQLGQYARAVTLLRAVLSASLTEDFRQRIMQQLAHSLARANRDMKQSLPRAKRPPVAVNY